MNNNGNLALVLNADFRPLSYFPLSLWCWQDSVKAVFLDRVNIISEYEVIISEFISLQIKISPKRRSKIFKYGLFFGIKSTLSYYYNNRTKNFVSGIKVVCRGK